MAMSVNAIAVRVIKKSLSGSRDSVAWRYGHAVLGIRYAMRLEHSTLVAIVYKPTGVWAFLVFWDVPHFQRKDCSTRF